MSDIDVVYISGAPRSGTTLLGMALGQLPACCDVGELWALWRPAFREGDLCGCGQPVRSCAFWLEVAARALGPDYETRGAALGRLHRETMGTLSAPKVWLHVSGRRRSAAYSEYADALGREYRAIAESSGGRVVVDSSKMASDALLADTIPGINLKVIHLIRDPRGVTWSWRKQMRQPGPRAAPCSVNIQSQPPPAGTPTTHSPNSSWRHASAIASDGSATRICWPIREANCRTWPAGSASMPPSCRSAADPQLVVERPTHPVWGNPVRMSSGTITLREDEEWRDRLPSVDRVMATVATLPFLLRYRYPAFGTRRP